MGFLVYHTSWHWIFYLLAIINLAQLLVRILLQLDADLTHKL
mgnify:CR=1 FL=1